MKNYLKIGNVVLGMRKDPVLIAGPCVIESESLTLKIAEKLKKACSQKKIPFIFKASYDKANRSSIKSYRGPGIREGLRILKRVKEELCIPVIADIHCREEIGEATEVLDIIQIPAYLCRQTDLLVATGKTGKPLNIKKGQFLAPWEMKNVIEKIESTGNRKIILTERGTVFGYNNLVSDMRSLVIMKKFGYPVFYDATHSVQKPGWEKTRSGGDSEFIEPLSRAAVAVGIDGIFIEVHPDPEKALSDAQNSLKLSKVPGFLSILKDISRSIRK